MDQSELEGRIWEAAHIDPAKLGDDCLTGTWSRWEWQDYVPWELVGLWKDLPMPMRAVIFICAFKECLNQPDPAE